MQARRINIDLPYIETKNYEHKHRIEYYREWLAKIDADAEKKDRHAEQECVLCWKASAMAGAAMTSRQCGLCDEMLRCSNTNVDLLCVSCAKKANLCKHCGADIDLKNRRKRNLPEKTKEIEKERYGGYDEQDV